VSVSQIALGARAEKVAGAPSAANLGAAEHVALGGVRTRRVVRDFFAGETREARNVFAFS